MSTLGVISRVSDAPLAMSVPQTEVSIPAGPRPPRAPRSSRRRGRGSANREGQQQQRPTSGVEGQATTQTQLPPPQSQPAPVSQQPNYQNDTSRSRKGIREGRGRRNRGNAPPRGQGQNGGQESQETRPPVRTRGMRARGFEAQLSQHGPASDDGAGHLNDHALRADVPDFVPGMPSASAGQPSGQSNKGKGKSRAPPPPKVTTKSTADDLATRIHEDISHNLDARILIMKMDGVVVRSVVTYFHVENIHVLSHVMKACVAVVKFTLRAVVIAASYKQKCCAALRTIKKTVESFGKMVRRTNGPAALVVEILAVVHSIVAYIHVRKTATHKIHTLPTARGHQMSLTVALAVKRRYLKFQDTHLGYLAKIRF
ncbi:Zinc finger NF-X1-type [Penicillium canescens]|uniref:Zinc finger NF-X1-type n=1 Tax=Penicillium canescens TaxID=5083 RepID=A0AAD6NE23_PENCN|nr:Zinc finger NF-X1-type [Penicillium canescens]KAJ6057613.1 Zinc finger NF-X1-type [Penicillium canescens]KAJ6058928.1 Zinc finger NF-X1-type [Penicillium canescens]